MNLMTIEEAQKAVERNAGILECILLDAEEAYGYVLAEDVFAKITQPPFRRSAMDGYALQAERIREASEHTPVRLRVEKTIYAGDLPYAMNDQSAAVRIMTGAPIPEDCDVVVPQEMTDLGEEYVEIYRSLPKERNCVPMGEDFMEGDLLAHAGDVVDSYTVASFAAGGVREVKVRRKIRAAIVTTGNELAASGGSLKPGQIYNSNRAFFINRLKNLGCDVIGTFTVTDDVSDIRHAIKDLTEREEIDLILTTGGISVGKRDYLPEVLERLNAEFFVRGMAIKPGSPTMAAGIGKTMLLCLSGNPYSAIAMFEVLYPYYEKKALQRRECRLQKAYAAALNEYPKASPRRRLVRGIVKPEGVYIPKDQRNGQLHGGIGTNCLVDIPAGSEKIAEGEQVSVFLIQGREV